MCIRDRLAPLEHRSAAVRAIYVRRSRVVHEIARRGLVRAVRRLSRARRLAAALGPRERSSERALPGRAPAVARAAHARVRRRGDVAAAPHFRARRRDRATRPRARTRTTRELTNARARGRRATRASPRRDGDQGAAHHDPADRAFRRDATTRATTRPRRDRDARRDRASTRPRRAPRRERDVDGTRADANSRIPLG